MNIIRTIIFTKSFPQVRAALLKENKSKVGRKKRNLWRFGPFIVQATLIRYHDSYYWLIIKHANTRSLNLEKMKNIAKKEFNTPIIYRKFSDINFNFNGRLKHAVKFREKDLY